MSVMPASSAWSSRRRRQDVLTAKPLLADLPDLRILPWRPKLQQILRSWMARNVESAKGACPLAQASGTARIEDRLDEVVLPPAE